MTSARRREALELVPGTHSICRLDPGGGIPDWAERADGAILAVVATAEELSIVCADHLPPDGTERSRGWRALRVVGVLDHSLTGVLASLAEPLARAGVPIFAVSSFDTDYLLVPGRSLQSARRALEEAGHRVEAPPGRPPAG